MLVCWATFALEKMQIDDPVGAVPVHFCNGLWGVIAVGLFANGNPDTALWNGVPSAVTGLFYGGGTGQLFAQGLEVVTVAVVVTGLSLIFFRIVHSLGYLRSDPQHELMGLDIPEMGIPGYTSDDMLMHGISGRRLAQPMPSARPTAATAAIGK